VFKLTPETERTVELLSRITGNVLFPILVAMYVLVRMEPAIDQLTQTVQKLTIVVAQLNGVDVHID